MNTNKTSAYNSHAKKIKAKQKYRFYEVGFYGSNAIPKMRSMLVQDVDNNTFFVYRTNRVIRPVKYDEIVKYSLGDGYLQHYKFFDKKDYKPLVLENNRFLYVPPKNTKN